MDYAFARRILGIKGSHSVKARCCCCENFRWNHKRRAGWFLYSLSASLYARVRFFLSKHSILLNASWKRAALFIPSPPMQNIVSTKRWTIGELWQVWQNCCRADLTCERCQKMARSRIQHSFRFISTTPVTFQIALLGLMTSLTPPFKITVWIQSEFLHWFTALVVLILSEVTSRRFVFSSLKQSPQSFNLLCSSRHLSINSSDSNIILGHPSKVLKLVHIRFVGVLDFQSYPLLIADQRFHDNIARRIGSREKLIKLQMNQNSFHPADLISVLRVLSIFALTCDSKGVSKGATMWLFNFSIRNRGTWLFNAPACFFFSSNWLLEVFSYIYSDVLIYPLARYSTAKLSEMQ